MAQTDTRETADHGARRSLRDPVLVLYLVATALLALYAVTLVTRPTGHLWSVIDNQLVDAFEVVLALGCLARACSRRPRRRIALLLGAGLLAWAIGDVVWTLESSPSSASVADAFYLAFYPLACLALIASVRAQVGRIKPSVWLDGAMAGLGAAAICAVITLDTIAGSIGGSAVSVTVNLAYPIGDLVLLGLAVGAVVIVPRAPARLLLFAAGCALMAIGDTVYLYQSSAGTYRVGTLLDVTWPAAMLAMSASVWLRSSRHIPRSPLAERAPRLLILGFVSVACFVILVLGNVEHVNTVALALAAATLMTRAARMAVSLREQKNLSEAQHHQALTDELTGLANRRHLLDELELALADQGRGGRPGQRRRPGRRPAHRGLGPVADRPRSLQGDQRLVRTPDRGRAAAPDRSPHPPSHPSRRPGGATGR